MEDEIKVGEYVRINHMYHEQKIAKIKKVLDKDPYYNDMQMYRIDTIHQHDNSCFPSFKIYKEDIIKHSPNIIDLIEEGDYVNGKRVYSIGTAIGNLPIINHTDGTFTPSNGVKSIVTKEQFNRIRYEVN